MTSGVFALIGVLIVRVFRANKEFGKIESKKINYTHVGLMIFTVLMTSLSLNVLIQIVFNFDVAFKEIYVETGFLNPSMNVVFWVIVTVANIVALFSAFGIVERSETARRIFIAVLPILFIFGSIRSVSDVLPKLGPDVPLGLTLAILIAGLLISYLPMFLFYRNNNVQNAIFDVVSVNNKEED